MEVREIGVLNFRADLLREEFRKNKLSQHKVALKMGLSDKTFTSKMNGYTDWKLSEIQQLQKLLVDLDVNQVFNLQKNLERSKKL